MRRHHARIENNRNYIFADVINSHMNIIHFLKNIFRLKPQRNFRKHKFAKPSRGNVLEVDVGRYIGDSGLTDYEIFFKVKRGRIFKRCIKDMKKNENTYNFNTLQLTPVSKSAYIIVIKQDIPYMKKKSIWKVILTKKQKGQKTRIIKIRR